MLSKRRRASNNLANLIVRPQVMDPDIDQDYAEFLKLLGMRIKQMRKERGLSLRDMVVKHNYHDSQWRRYERGGPINVPSLLKIAKSFGTSLSAIVEGLGEYPAACAGEVKPKAKKKQSESRPDNGKKKKA
jgi:transcriptional regulator with XRE-family HTH domain